MAVETLRFPHPPHPDRHLADAPFPCERLTPREREILLLLVERRTDLEIAEALCISPRTVHHHVASIRGKLGARNRREVGAVAVHLGLV
jgi:DNA-binding CsgD family transcriptional regulator